MNRRTFLASSAVALGALGGCSSSRSGIDGSPPATETRTPPLSGGDEAYRDGFAAGDSWPVDCFDAGRRGVNPDAAPPTGDVGTAWLRTPVEGRRTFWTTAPVTDGRRVYVGSGSGEDEDEDQLGGFVAAFDGETGERAWRTTVTAGVVDGVAYAAGAVLATSADHGSGTATLTALGAAEGRERWQVDLPGSALGGPVAVGDRAVVTTREGGLTAVSLDGNRRWERSVGEGEEYASTPPCATDSSVFVGTDRGRVVAVAVGDGSRQSGGGTLQWAERIVDGGHRPRLQTTPTVADGAVFVAGTDYRLYAADATDGTRRWDVRLLDRDRGNPIPSVAVAGDTLYVNTIHGGLLALRRRDGGERWRTGAYGAGFPPAVAGDVAVFPTIGGGVRAVDADGEPRWRVEMRPFDAGMAAYVMNPQVALAHGRAYVSLNDGRVFSLGGR